MSYNIIICLGRGFGVLGQEILGSWSMRRHQGLYLILIGLNWHLGHRILLRRDECLLVGVPSVAEEEHARLVRIDLQRHRLLLLLLLLLLRSQLCLQHLDLLLVRSDQLVVGRWLLCLRNRFLLLARLGSAVGPVFRVINPAALRILKTRMMDRFFNNQASDRPPRRLNSRKATQQSQLTRNDSSSSSQYRQPQRLNTIKPSEKKRQLDSEEAYFETGPGRTRKESDLKFLPKNTPSVKYIPSHQNKKPMEGQTVKETEEASNHYSKVKGSDSNKQQKRLRYDKGESFSPEDRGIPLESEQDYRSIRTNPASASAMKQAPNPIPLLGSSFKGVEGPSTDRSRAAPRTQQFGTMQTFQQRGRLNPPGPFAGRSSKDKPFGPSSSRFSEDRKSNQPPGKETAKFQYFQGVSVKGRPGQVLGGGTGIFKLSKLDNKEQEEVNDITEDEDDITYKSPAPMEDPKPMISSVSYENTDGNMRDDLQKLEQELADLKAAQRMNEKRQEQVLIMSQELKHNRGSMKMPNTKEKKESLFIGLNAQTSPDLQKEEVKEPPRETSKHRKGDYIWIPMDGDEETEKLERSEPRIAPGDLPEEQQPKDKRIREPFRDEVQKDHASQMKQVVYEEPLSTNEQGAQETPKLEEKIMKKIEEHHREIHEMKLRQSILSRSASPPNPKILNSPGMRPPSKQIDVYQKKKSVDMNNDLPPEEHLYKRKGPQRQFKPASRQYTSSRQSSSSDVRSNDRARRTVLVPKGKTNLNTQDLHRISQYKKATQKQIIETMPPEKLKQSRQRLTTDSSSENFKGSFQNKAHRLQNKLIAPDRFDNRGKRKNPRIRPKSYQSHSESSRSQSKSFKEKSIILEEYSASASNNEAEMKKSKPILKMAKKKSHVVTKSQTRKDSRISPMRNISRKSRSSYLYNQESESDKSNQFPDQFSQITGTNTIGQSGINQFGSNRPVVHHSRLQNPKSRRIDHSKHRSHSRTKSRQQKEPVPQAEEPAANDQLIASYQQQIKMLETQLTSQQQQQQQQQQPMPLQINTNQSSMLLLSHRGNPNQQALIAPQQYAMTQMPVQPYQYQVQTLMSPHGPGTQNFLSQNPPPLVQVPSQNQSHISPNFNSQMTQPGSQLPQVPGRYYQQVLARSSPDQQLAGQEGYHKTPGAEAESTEKQQYQMEIQNLQSQITALTQAMQKQFNPNHTQRSSIAEQAQPMDALSQAHMATINGFNQSQLSQFQMFNRQFVQQSPIIDNSNLLFTPQQVSPHIPSTSPMANPTLNLQSDETKTVNNNSNLLKDTSGGNINVDENLRNADAQHQNLRRPHPRQKSTEIVAMTPATSAIPAGYEDDLPDVNIISDLDMTDQLEEHKMRRGDSEDEDDLRLQNYGKGSFAPSPDKIVQMQQSEKKKKQQQNLPSEHFNDNSDMNPYVINNLGLGREHPLSSPSKFMEDEGDIQESPSRPIPPDFNPPQQTKKSTYHKRGRSKVDKRTDDQKTNRKSLNHLLEEVDAFDNVPQQQPEQVAPKDQQLLLIGFDEPPKGKNPLIGSKERWKKSPIPRDMFMKKQEEAKSPYARNPDFDFHPKHQIDPEQESRSITVPLVSQYPTRATRLANQRREVKTQLRNHVQEHPENKEAELIIVNVDDADQMPTRTKRKFWMKSSFEGEDQEEGMQWIRPQKRLQAPSQMEEPGSKTVSPVSRRTGFADPSEIINDEFNFKSKDNPFLKRPRDFQDGKKSARTSNKGKTREELIEIRKKMLKEKFKDRQENNKSPLGSQLPPQEVSNNSGFLIPKEDQTEMLSARNQELMARLASGVKVSVQKKEMKKLTKKNYEKLPEIIAKKEEAKKNEEILAKKKRYAEYQKELDQRLRNNLKRQREKAKYK